MNKSKQNSKCEKEVMRFAKKLCSSKIKGQALDILKALSTLPITQEILEKTRIGKAVNSLRKSSIDIEVITLAKLLIKNWQKCIPCNNKGDGHKIADSSSKQNIIKIIAQTHASNIPFIYSSANLTDDVRIKCHEQLTVSLTAEEMPQGDKGPSELAATIEDIIFTEFKDTNMKYKNRIRSRVFNLRDPKNPNLKRNVLVGAITPQQIATMTFLEMASDEMKLVRECYTKKAIGDCTMPVTTGTSSGLFKCGKCLKRNCSYTQLQTRSADEPMTTFVWCNECGNRWKFC